ncbi:MAG: ankyrin repeat domain-containing protein [Deltaproteobacteria bacterium]|nr:ankyrin repeat domain-containing protein [Deltaproteobacteria bacterium]
MRRKTYSWQEAVSICAPDTRGFCLLLLLLASVCWTACQQEPPSHQAIESPSTDANFRKRNSKLPQAPANPSAALLISTIEKGDRAKVRHLLALGADPAEHGPDGRTGLHAFFSPKNWSIDPDLLKDLLEAGCNLNARDAGGATPLHLAVRRGHLGLIKTLLLSGASTAVQDKEGRTLLHSALEHNQDKVLQYFLEHNLSANLANAEGRTPLHLARDQNNPDNAFLLVAFGADPRKPDAYGDSPLPWLTQRCLQLMVKIPTENELIDHPCARIPELRSPALHMAVAQGQERLAQGLLRAGADPLALYALIPEMNVAATALHAAAVGGHLDSLNLLLKKNIPVDTPDAAGWTALHRAVWKNHEPIIRRLLTAKANPKQKTRSGSNAYDLAEQRGYINILKILKEASPKYRAK